MHTKYINKQVGFSNTKMFVSILQDLKFIHNIFFYSLSIKTAATYRDDVIGVLSEVSVYLSHRPLHTQLNINNNSFQMQPIHLLYTWSPPPEGP